MKIKLLRRLRDEARIEYSSPLISEFMKLLGWSYIQAERFIKKEERLYILRRVAELKQKKR
jgi:hypothetical protein